MMPNQDRSLVRLPRADAATLAMTAAFAVKFSYTLAPAGYQPPPIPPVWLTRVSGDYPRLPDDVKRKNVGKRLTGMYVIAVDRDGQVTAVETKVSIPGADAAIIATIKA